MPGNNRVEDSGFMPPLLPLLNALNAANKRKPNPTPIVANPAVAVGLLNREGVAALGGSLGCSKVPVKPNGFMHSTAQAL